MPDFTPQQTAAISTIAAGEPLAMRAVAGAGKTTTLVAGLNKTSIPGLALAFNKRNAEDLQAKVPSNIKAQTLNALGHRVWSDHLGRRLQVSSDKTKDIINELNIKVRGDEWVALVKLVGLAKAYAITPGLLGQPLPDLEEWKARWDERDGDTDLFDGLVEHAVRVLQTSVKQAWEGKIDYDDQLYMPVVFRSRFPTYQLVAVDEAQDLSTLQHEMVARLKPKQLIVVGDPAQAIYAFRGASSSSFSELSERFGLRELPLTVSFRCPKSVGREAAYYVSDFSCLPSAPEGQLIRVTSANPQPGQTVICRYNAPLIDLAFACLRRRLPVNYLGRDFLSGIKTLHKKHPTPSALEVWLKRKQEEAKSAGAKARAEDQFNSLMTLHTAAADQHTTVEALIEDLLRGVKSGQAVTLSTVHKAKGLEWNDVTLLRYDLSADGGQEANINYVGVTRAQQTLRLQRKDW